MLIEISKAMTYTAIDSAYIENVFLKYSVHDNRYQQIEKYCARVLPSIGVSHRGTWIFRE